LHRETDIQTDIQTETQTDIQRHIDRRRCKQHFMAGTAGNYNKYVSMAWENVCLKAFDRDKWREWTAGCDSHWMES